VPPFKYYTVDVFAETKYAGNQLAVIRGAGDLPTAEMQRIALEMNYSETTFMLSDEPRDGAHDVRIFTPAAEVPFAGHPTLGTAFVIRQELMQPTDRNVVLNLKVGRIPVTFEDVPGEAEVLWMRQRSPEFGAEVSAETMAGVLGLAVDQMDARFPFQEVSTGLPFWIAPLVSLQALNQARTNQDHYERLVRDSPAKGVLLFCAEANEPGNDLCTRMFAEFLGVTEDPATGSANGCLAGYLIRHDYFGGGSIDIRVEQGYQIRRPSLLRLRARVDGEEIGVEVGGRVIPVAVGELL
jgi:trans-2,3-dihydro-3-hydroxyanthranilate isomerase